MTRAYGGRTVGRETARADGWLAEWDRRTQEGERARDVSRSIAAREELSLVYVQTQMADARKRRQNKLEAMAMRPTNET